MMRQLDLDGHEVAHPPRARRRLTERQRDLLRWLRVVSSYGSLLATAEVRRFYADPSGALRRLEALGLVEQVKRGRWRAR